MPKKKGAGKKGKTPKKKKSSKKLSKTKSQESIATEAPPAAPVDVLPNASNSIYCET